MEFFYSNYSKDWSFHSVPDFLDVLRKEFFSFKFLVSFFFVCVCLVSSMPEIFSSIFYILLVMLMSLVPVS
jgi:hypothetical protein